MWLLIHDCKYTVAWALAIFLFIWLLFLTPLYSFIHPQWNVKIVKLSFWGIATYTKRGKNTAFTIDVCTSIRIKQTIHKILTLSFNRYDDYDYGEINQLLDRSFKVYIKTVVCTPEKVTKRMYDSFWRQFKHSEKVSTYCVYSNLAVILILLHLI